MQTVANGNWGLSFQEEGKAPVANAPADYLKKFDACYAEQTDEKVLYITFDAGFENGNTEAILDALKKHNAPAAFFLVGNYLETAPELVKRMVDEGHIVGNHTWSHPDMSKISTEHNAPAAFFLVGNYLETAPELVKRMVDEGHIVGNHTWSHPDMSKISTEEAFRKELTQVEERFKEVTGQEMQKFR